MGISLRAWRIAGRKQMAEAFDCGIRIAELKGVGQRLWKAGMEVSGVPPEADQVSARPGAI